MTTCNLCGKPFENRYSRPAWYGGSCKQCVLKFYDDRKREKREAQQKKIKELLKYGKQP